MKGDLAPFSLGNFSLFLLQNIDYGFSLEPPREVVLTVV